MSNLPGKVECSPCNSDQIVSFHNHRINNTYTQKWENDTETMISTSCQRILPASSLGTMSLLFSQYTIQSHAVHLLQCLFNTKIEIIHLCWGEQLMKAANVNCSSSFLCKFRTVSVCPIHLWNNAVIFKIWHNEKSCLLISQMPLEDSGLSLSGVSNTPEMSFQHLPWPSPT